MSLSSLLTFDSTDTVQTVTYYDPSTDTYPALELSYMLYSNTDGWTIFTDFVADTTTNTVTTNEETNSTGYSDYTLRFVCDISGFTT